MAGLFQTRERRALVVFLLLAGVFVAGLLLAERRESAVSADRAEAEMEATGAADSVRLFEFDPNTVSMPICGGWDSPPAWRSAC